MPSLSATIDYDASLSWDGLNILVWRGGALSIATRATLDSQFGAPAAAPLYKTAGDWLVQAQDPEVPTLSGDGLSLFAHWGGRHR